MQYRTLVYIFVWYISDTGPSCDQVSMPVGYRTKVYIGYRPLCEKGIVGGPPWCLVYIKYRTLMFGLYVRYRTLLWAGFTTLLGLSDTGLYRYVLDTGPRVNKEPYINELLV